MKGNYDNAAPFYDRLAYLIFGDAILQAHLYLVNAIPPGTSILITGGGTGRILEEISNKHVTGLQITYVEISKKMIALSRKRNTGNNNIIFINQSILEVTFDQQFDVVITPFIFDNFSNSTSNLLFDKVDTLLKPRGLWLFADFQLSKENNLWQKLLMNLMYFFFKLLCGIEASHLPDTASLFKKYRYQPVSKQTFFRKFICSVVYLKPGI